MRHLGGGRRRWDQHMKFVVDMCVHLIMCGIRIGFWFFYFVIDDGSMVVSTINFRLNEIFT